MTLDKVGYYTQVFREMADSGPEYTELMYKTVFGEIDVRKHYDIASNKDVYYIKIRSQDKMVGPFETLEEVLGAYNMLKD